MAVEPMNEAVLHEIEFYVLVPEAVEQAILLTEREDLVDRRTQLEVEREKLDRQIERLVEAIARGGQLESLLDKVRGLEARRSAIDVDLSELRPVPRLAPEVIEGRLAEWRRILRGSATQARTVLNRVLSERITFTPRADGSGYDFTAPTRFDKLFTGIGVGKPDRKSFIPEGNRTGTEGIGPEDTGEVEYERLLEAAQNSTRSIGAPGGIRTPDLRLRRPALYPTELRAHHCIISHTRTTGASRKVRHDGCFTTGAHDRCSQQVRHACPPKRTAKVGQVLTSGALVGSRRVAQAH
jgi:hypothetical protein